MSEQQEGAPIPSEVWVTIKPETRERVESYLLNIGAKHAGATHVLELSGVERKRAEQVFSVISSASTSIFASEVTKKRTSLDIVLRIDNGESTYGVVVAKFDKESDIDYSRRMNEIVERANGILEVFDKPKIPAFGSSTTTTI